jgi:hypothetical protein
MLSATILPTRSMMPPGGPEQREQEAGGHRRAESWRGHSSVAVKVP